MLVLFTLHGLNGGFEENSKLNQMFKYKYNCIQSKHRGVFFIYTRYVFEKNNAGIGYIF